MSGERYRDGRYAAEHPGWHAEDSPWKAERVAEALERVGLEPRSVCDVGCGAGRVLDHLREALPAGCTLEGWDVSPQAIERARAAGAAGIDLRVGDFLEEERRVDLVLALDVVEHVEDYLGFLRRLRPRGRFHVFHVPLELCAAAALRPAKLLESRRSVGHLHPFHRETFLASLEDAGYRVRDAAYTPAIFQAPVTSLRSRVGRWTRRALAWLSPDLAARGPGGFSLMVVTEDPEAGVDTGSGDVDGS